MSVFGNFSFALIAQTFSGNRLSQNSGKVFGSRTQVNKLSFFQLSLNSNL